MLKNFGRKVYLRRTALGMTQQELAEQMGYKSKSSINKLELGVNDLTQSKILKLSRILGVEPGYFFFGKEAVDFEGYLPYLAKASEETLRIVRKILDMPDPEEKQELEKKSSDKIVG